MVLCQGWVQARSNGKARRSAFRHCLLARDTWVF